MLATFTRKLALTLDMIKFKHSVFALPFALTSLFFATNGKPSARQFILIVLCMVSARTAAMTFNRIVDRDIDEINPRTKSRPIPAGQLSLRFSIVFCLVACGLFIFFASLFNQLTLLLSPAALLIILGYSLTKRFTHLTQFFLGLALGISPLATWIAITGSISPFPALLGAGVFFWVAGFDLIYSCQDYDFDKANDLKNLVVKIGVAKALTLSKMLHGLCLAFFLLAGLNLNLRIFYLTGLIVMSGFLIYEHRIITPTDLSRVDLAFFTLNGYVALSFFIFSILEIYG